MKNTGVIIFSIIELLLISSFLILWLVPIDPVTLYVYKGVMVADESQIGEIRKELVLKSDIKNIKERLDTINDSGYKFLVFDDFYSRFQLETIDKTTITETKVRPDKDWVHALMVINIAILFVYSIGYFMYLSDELSYY